MADAVRVRGERRGVLSYCTTNIDLQQPLPQPLLDEGPGEDVEVGGSDEGTDVRELEIYR
jgi:hypothetical protein